MREFTKKFQEVVNNYRQNSDGQVKSYGEIFADAGMPDFFKNATIEDLRDAQSHYKGMLAIMFGQMADKKSQI